MLRKVRQILHTLAVWQLTVLLFILYLIVVMPLGILERLFIHRLSGWVNFKDSYQTLHDLQQQ